MKIGTKINALIAGTLFVGVVGTVSFATGLFSADLVGLLRKTTLDVSSATANRLRAELKHIADQARMFGSASYQEFKYPQDRIKFIQDGLTAHAYLLGLSLFEKKGTQWTPRWRLSNQATTMPVQDLAAIDPYSARQWDLLAKTGEPSVSYFPQSGKPVLRAVFPLLKLKDGTFSQFIVADVDHDYASGLLANNLDATHILVDANGSILLSTQPNLYASGTLWPSFSKIGAGMGMFDFEDAQGRLQVAAYQHLSVADLILITQVSQSGIYTKIFKIIRRAAWLAGLFLFLSLTVGLTFSKTLTRPILRLAHAAKQIRMGNFAVRLSTDDSSAHHRESSNEILQLSTVFDDMAVGLQERDRVKATFQKFHSREVAEQLLSGSISLGGARKSAVVFFSDIRGFTALSEDLDAEVVVSILNRYMTTMVHIIHSHGGVVDKFIGDSIMAIWGVPLERADDSIRAVRACQDMRTALEELNHEFAAEGLPEIRVGMGLNYGPLVAGNIGSEERMEYTVIGDTVNTASRIESITKELNTDLLISDTVAAQVADEFHLERMGSVRAKGKKNELVLYKVLFTESGSKDDPERDGEASAA